MARARRRPPTATEMIIAQGGNPILAIADEMNAGTGAPSQAEGYSIHFAIQHVAGVQGSVDGFDVDRLELICKEAPKGERRVVAAPHDHPAFCPRCRAGKPSAVGSLVRVVPVLVSS